MKKVSQKNASSLLEQVDGVMDVYCKRWEWVDGLFIPAVETLADSRRPCYRRLAAFGYYILGDVHDFNDAPKAAIRAYRKSIALEPNHGAAWREIGIMLEDLGQVKKAVAALRTAIELDPDDECARHDLKCIIEYPSEQPLYQRSDPIWESSEFLAAGKHLNALQALARQRSEKARRQRARVFGALRDSSSALTQWEKIAKSQCQFELDGSDFYFMANDLWNDSEVWSMLWSARSYIICSNLLWPDPPEGLRGRRYRELQLRFHLVRTKGRSASRTRLAIRYPQWNEFKELIKHEG